ncbi:MAG: hypothetical protein FWF88_11995 [Peptococcaceae bacterium]|nr:hypothetical protein [Peptococcaceae bacterium]
MNTNYPFIKSKRKEYYSKWLNNHEKWKKRKIIVAIFYVVAAAVFIAVWVYLLLVEPFPYVTINEILLVLLASTFCGMIPWFIGIALSMRWKSKYGAPFSHMRKEFLLVDEKGLEFGYIGKDWKWEFHQRIIYRIEYDSIINIDIDRDFHICTIRGYASLTPHGEGPLQENSSVEFPSWPPFYFLFSFDDQDGFEQYVKGKVYPGVWGKYKGPIELNSDVQSTLRGLLLYLD